MLGRIKKLHLLMEVLGHLRVLWELCLFLKHGFLFFKASLSSFGNPFSDFTRIRNMNVSNNHHESYSCHKVRLPRKAQNIIVNENYIEQGDKPFLFSFNFQHKMKMDFLKSNIKNLNQIKELTNYFIYENIENPLKHPGKFFFLVVEIDGKSYVSIMGKNMTHKSIYASSSGCTNQTISLNSLCPKGKSSYVTKDFILYPAMSLEAKTALEYLDLQEEVDYTLGQSINFFANFSNGGIISSTNSNKYFTKLTNEMIEMLCESKDNVIFIKRNDIIYEKIVEMVRMEYGLHQFIYLDFMVRQLNDYIKKYGD